MTTAEKVIKNKMELIKLAEQLGNVSQACKIMGYSRDSFIKMLLNWLEEISNYFIHRDTSGFVEGFNNKIKVLKRRCYGIFNIHHLFYRIYLDLEGYRIFA